jgi:hypothetical protein
MIKDKILRMKKYMTGMAFLQDKRAAERISLGITYLLK